MTDHLEPDRGTREDLTRLFGSYLDDWLDRAADMDASGDDLDAETLERLQRPPGETGTSPEEVLAVLQEAGRGGIYHPSGGHLSYIPNAGLYTAALGEFIAAGLNRYTGIAGAAPGFVAMEHGVVDWIASLFDPGPDSSGILLSGGSMANLTALVTARITRLGDDFAKGCLYVTPHTHHSVAKAARIAGFRADQIVSIEVDDDLRMDPDALRRRVASDRAEGRQPFLVVASAGTTDTGTVDDLNQIADVASESGLWLHVDAAYGGFFILTDRGRKVLDGIHRSDSIALDPHKGLSIPFGVGALVVKQESHLVDAHLGRGAYLRDEDNYAGVRDIASLGPELSRPFRGLSVWLPLQLHGVAPFRDALDRSLDLAEHAYVRLAGLPGIEKIWAPDLSIVAFWLTDDDVGRRILEGINTGGRVHLSPTRVKDRYVLRLAILNRRTTREHVDHAIDLIEEALSGSG